MGREREWAKPKGPTEQEEMPLALVQIVTLVAGLVQNFLQWVETSRGTATSCRCSTGQGEESAFIVPNLPVLTSHWSQVCLVFPSLWWHIVSPWKALILTGQAHGRRSL